MLDNFTCRWKRWVDTRYIRSFMAPTGNNNNNGIAGCDWVFKSKKNFEE